MSENWAGNDERLRNAALRNGNHSSTSLNLPTSDQNVPSVLPLRGEPEGHEDPLPTLPAKSSKLQVSSNPNLQTPIPFNHQTSSCVKIKGCSGSPAKTSNPATSSTTGRAVSNFIRFSAIPPNSLGPLAFRTPFCSGTSYSTPLSFGTTHSTPKEHSALEKVGRIKIITQNIIQDSVGPLRISQIGTTNQVTNSSCSTALSRILTDSPCSTMGEVENMENIQIDTNCSSRENSQNSSDPMFSVPHNTPLENENINASPSENRLHSSEPMYSVPYNTPLENENINASPSENRLNSSDPMYSVPHNTPLKNENALETSRFPVDRQCSSRLQVEATPSENSQNSPDPVYPVPPNTPLGNSEESLIFSKENTDNGNRNFKPSVNINSGSLPFKGNSTYHKSVSEENGQNITPLKNEISSKTSIYPVKRHYSSQFQTEASPLNISSSPLRESKHIKDATGCTNRFVMNPDKRNQSTKNKPFKNLHSGCQPFKGNSTYPKSASEENYQNTARLKNENSSKTSRFPVKRRCPPQLQRDASPSNTSKCPLHESKHIENATGCTNRFALHFDDQNQSTKNKFFKNHNSGCHPFTENFTYPKSASEENGQSSTPLKKENSLKISTLQVKRQRSSQLKTDANTSNCPSRESKRMKNATGCTNRFALYPDDQSTKNVRSSVNLNSGSLPFKGNSKYPKSTSEKNGQSNTPLKNENYLKASAYPVKRQRSSKLQTDASPSNTSKCPLHGSKHIENSTGPNNRFLYPDELYPRPEVRPSGNSKAANTFLEKNCRGYSMLSRYPEEHARESLATSNPKKSQPSLNERTIIENVVESLRQSYISLSLTNDLPTYASEMSAPSNKPDLKSSANSRNETRKKSKLISFFTTCCRSSDPRQERQI